MACQILGYTGLELQGLSLDDLLVQEAGRGRGLDALAEIEVATDHNGRLLRKEDADSTGRVLVNGKVVSI